LNRKCEENTKIFKQENKKNLILLLRFYIRLEKVIISSLFQKEKTNQKGILIFFFSNFIREVCFFIEENLLCIQVFFWSDCFKLATNEQFFDKLFHKKKGKIA
jgi:hypothetical protein